MTFLLLGQPLLELLHELVPAEFFELCFFFRREMLLHHLAQPVFRNVGFKAGDFRHTMKITAKGAVELVVVRLVLDEAGAREHIEIVEAVPGQTLLEGFEQGQKFARRYR